MDIEFIGICDVKSCTSIVRRVSEPYCSVHRNRYYKYGSATPTLACANKSCRVSFQWETESILNNHYCPECSSILKRCSAYIPKQVVGITRHGISLIDYLKRLEAQRFSCAIPSCGVEFNDMTNGQRRPGIDHDHSCCKGGYSCGKCIRGIVCQRCNVVIHHFEVNGFLFEDIDKYLVAHKVSV